MAPLLFSRELQMGEEKLPKPTTLGSAVSAGEGRWGEVILHSLWVSAPPWMLRCCRFRSLHGSAQHWHGISHQPFKHACHTSLHQPAQPASLLTKAA